MTDSEIETLQTTQPYQDQVWAAYGKSSWIFSKHRDQEDCIKHISYFFGINRELAKEILGKDWKEPEVIATQLDINFNFNKENQ